MNDYAIEARGLSKRYVIRGKQERYKTIRESLMNAAKAPFRNRRSASDPESATKRNSDSHLWALKDLSLDVKHGDIIGLIGRNGAGKSTLLKVLSRITEPTEGHAVVRGRLASLLEVGTGFHRELTGRENIYLNGSILGMKRAEVRRRFDEIVSFAEVERFIDTPVKHYSSGMYLRLAFGVAAHLEPDILLIDELLAVGDAKFQQKCLGKIDDVAKMGRTVLFVSHNMGAVRSICRRGIMLHDGKVAEIGDIGDVIESYYRHLGVFDERNESESIDSSNGRSVFGPIRIEGVQGNTIDHSEPFIISIPLNVYRDVAGFTLECRLTDMLGRPIFNLRSDSTSLGFDNSGEPNVLTMELPAMWMAPGMYAVDFRIRFQTEFRSIRNAVSDKFPIDVVGTPSVNDAILQPQVRWSLEQSDATNTLLPRAYTEH